VKFKVVVSQLMPPILWSLGEKLRSKSSSGIKIPETTLQPTASNDQFNLPFTRVNTSAGSFFVPKYGEHRPASKAVLNGRFYEPKTHSIIAELLKIRPGNIVHAGTFFGDMLPSFSRACSETVYAFEPVLENYVLAKLCVEQNELENVLIQNAGLSSSIKVARVDTGVQQGAHRGGGSKISDSGQFTALVTIDSLGISNLSVIQLDVEGHELEALRGAVETIRANQPLILIEDNNDNCQEFLHSVEYQYVGKIPGLRIWKAEQDDIDIQNILDRI
jgi:FkbM family methyltransferase